MSILRFRMYSPITLCSGRNHAAPANTMEDLWMSPTTGTTPRGIMILRRPIIQ